MIAKEFRALVWPWVATLALLVVLTSSYAGHLRSLAILAYFFGAAALSALSVGHEYSYRTLGVLLAQPLSRARILRAKLVVLLPMLAIVMLAGWLTAPFERGDDEEMTFWIPILSLCVGPWMTMICRNAVAGGVFAVGIPGGLLAASNFIATRVYGSSGDVDIYRNTIFWIGAAAVSSVGVILGLRTFLNLEAIEGRDPELQLPPLSSALPRFRGAFPRFRGPVWMLVKKELRLQQMAFVVSAVYLVEAGAAWAFTESRNSAEVFDVLSVLFGFLIGPLIGSLASAEERHLGTHDWQVLLPIASWIQWTIKVTVALTLAVALAVGLPSLFAADVDVAQAPFVLPVVLITSAAIYISSRSSSGIQAMLVSFALLPVVAILITQASVGLWGVTPAHFPPAIFVAAAALLLYGGLSNHRSFAGARG